MKVGTIAQLTNCLPYKLRNRISSPGPLGMVHASVIPLLGKSILRLASQPASIAYLTSSRTVKDPVFKKYSGQDQRRDTRGRPLGCRHSLGTRSSRHTHRENRPGNNGRKRVSAAGYCHRSQRTHTSKPPKSSSSILPPAPETQSN